MRATGTATGADRAFGTVLRRHRKAAGLSQGALAAVAGVSFQQLQKYETGANRVSIGRLFDIATGLGIDPTALVADTVTELDSGETGAAPRQRRGPGRTADALRSRKRSA